MANSQIKTRIIHKHDTEANWNLATNFIPKQGEIIVYDKDSTYDYERFKIGDGATFVSSLPFANDALKAEIQTLLDGKASTSSVTQLTNKVDGKVDKDGSKVLSTNDYTTAEKNKLAGIAAGAQVNQNAFSNVVIGSTTIAADSKTDTLTFVAGTNITLTPDATNDKITITAVDTTYGAAGSSLGLVKTGGDVTISSGTITVNDDSHNHVIDNIDNLKNTLDAKISAGELTVTTSGSGNAITSASYDSSKRTITLNKGASYNNYTYTLPAAGSSLGGVKTGGDVTISDGVISVKDGSHNHIISNVDGLQNALDSKASKSDYETFKTNVNTLLDSDDTTLDQMSEIVAYIKNNKGLIDSITTAKQDKITGAATTITGSDLTPNRVLVSDSNGKVAALSSITTDELGYLDGATSNLQTQITSAKNTADAKLAAADITVNVTGTGNAITAASYDDKGTITLTKGATFNNYSLPTASSTLGGVKTTSTVTSASGHTPVPIIDGVPYYKDTTYDVATTSTAGLMSANDKNKFDSAISKLDGIANNANNYSLPTASSSTKGGVKTGAAITDTTGYTAVHIKDGVIYYKDTNTHLVTSVFGRTGDVSLSKSDVTTALGYTPPTSNTTYNVATSNTLGLTKPAYSSTGAATLTTTAGSNNSTPTIAARTTTSGRYYAVETDKNGVLFVNVPWSNAVSSVAGKTGTVTLAKSDVGLDKVENKSSATIRGELTKDNVVTALGYTPPTTNTTYSNGSGLSLTGTTFSVNTGYTTSGKNYKVNVDGTTGGLYVYVPWTDTHLVTSVFGKTGDVTLTKDDVTKALGYTPPTTNTTYSLAKYNNSGLVKPAYSSTGAATLTTTTAENTSTPTIAARTTTSGRYYAIETDKNGIMFVNVPWTNTHAVSSVAGKTGAVTLTSSDVGLGDVENKSSATIRGELTKANVTDALGYTPPTTNTTYDAGTGLSLSGTTFSVKTDYTTSGKNYKVQADSNGNLYVNVPWTDSTPVTSVFGRTGAVTLKKEDVTTALGYTPPTSNTTYSAATYSTLGLVKPAYTSTGAASLTTAAATNTTTPTIAAKTTTSGRYYAVEADKNGVLFVNVPWVDTNTHAVTSVFGRTGAVTLTKSDVTTALGYTPPTTDTNTHYTTRLYAGESGTAAHSAVTNPYLKVTDDNTYRSQVRFVGSGATTVSSDANGVITISSTDTNTNTDTKVTQSRSTASNYRPILMHYSNGDYGTDVGSATNSVYYNETIAAKASTGELKATSFVGSGASLTSLNATHISSGTIAADRLPTSGVTAGTYGPSAAVTGNNNATMNVPEITVDSYGRVTKITNRVYTAKNSTYTIPTSLKNPNALTVYGGSTKCFTYDGSAAKTLTIKAGSNITVTGDTSGNITIASSYSYSLPTATSSTKGGVIVGSNITVSSGTISLTKANVVAALGYTPPTSDTNTTYSAGTGLSLSGTKFSVSTVPVGNGGTGATSKSGARTNLGITSGTSLPSSGSTGDIFFLYKT